MGKLITVEKAQKEIMRLKQYVALVEDYKADTLDKWIIKEYAYTNSIVKVIRSANQKGISVTPEYAKSVIKGKPTDELHKFLKSGYLERIRPKDDY
jgi:hypothetical protein